MYHPSAVRRLPALVIVGAAIVLLAGCAGVGARDYQDTQPQFTLRQFFNGPILSTGVFRERSGKVVRRFHARLDGEWQGNDGTLSEHFDYVGDHPDAARIWHLTQQDIHHFTGTGQGSAGNIVGTAKGDGYGYALHWSYDVDLPTGDTTHQVHFDDWMWMVDPNTVIDHSTVTKFGITVGTLNMVMQKLDPATGKPMQPAMMNSDNGMNNNSNGSSSNADTGGEDQSFGFK